MTKVMTVVGTRPEIIRLSRVMARLDATCDHVLVHTGQNYDYELNGIFFEEMGIRKPDRFMEVNTGSLGAVLGGVLAGTEEAILQERPDALLVLGDTNSCIAAVMAKRMRIPVYHMEAGNRCFDENVPEETNRRMVDHVSDYNLVYTEHARRNLLAEGMAPRRILKTGSPMKEVLLHHRDQFAASQVLTDAGLTSQGFLLVSAHREENVDSPARLAALLDCLEAAQREYDVPMLVSTHPRTRKRVDALLTETGRVLSEQIVFHAPLGFADYVRLQQESLAVLSDSGTISEESALLGFPAVTLRDSIERPEALDTGAIVMTGLDPENVVEGLRTVLAERDGDGRVHPVVPEDYAIDNCSQRAVNFILSTHRRHEQWSGLRQS
ncbi:UDP-2,3-diacetamido-2,3-dideoxy-D-glucuronate 2-epimerase [Austwickia sp. TVS 96-490-7B]|uniref:non-hydrolyzing UDP-N-acetylglucosamine 2-epimerase n=1 Tax=Austwickia sp. TVS 96-490-7B TaxID=2830843 RepID=UPI001C580807|nr:UDP-N-acetylglucosamine 2-epimerase (non-hydrolyzing) [Austwickia sp. TVS 96-490-7B]MBW3084635.1 UDP-2,3-diacetamido-2,3-dideoxy-D-glucuronate 2-epimerase [Austwickia sp. TVS 96-490-7B]